jgi:hypothetical protein
MRKTPFLQKKHFMDIIWEGLCPKKIYRLKEDQAFWVSLELGRREKFARHMSADFLPPSPPPVRTFVFDG